jgi:DNA-binding CsgD family transcriptional regulator
VLSEIERREASRQAPAWAFALEARARLLLLQGRPQEAHDLLVDCGKRALAMNTPNPAVLPWRSRAALALAHLGEHDEARRLVGEEIELARRFGAPRAIGIALRAGGLIERGDESVDRLREAVTVLERSEARLELARAVIDLGAALRRAGHRRESRTPLRQGLDLAHRFGAAPLEALARSELEAAGARPRRATLTGVSSLTPSERRVAEMAADGLTNREIAQALFVTVKAVQWHLGNAYRKLDVTSREHLPRPLGRARGAA